MLLFLRVTQKLLHVADSLGPENSALMSPHLSRQNQAAAMRNNLR
jgi:hypothetical protein